MVHLLRRLLPRPAPTDAEAVTPATVLDVGGSTALGARAENQDRARTGPTWLVVSDGVGGHAGGARAASLAVEAAADQLAHGGPTSPPVREAVQAAHAAVRGGQVVDPTVHHMAATVTVARASVVSLGTSRWVVAHVGDSPAWRVADGRAVQVTADHTVAGELLAAGSIGPATAADHPGRRFVTRVAGAPESVDPDVVEVVLGAGDSLVVATDGVSDVLAPAAIAAAVDGAATAATAARALVVAARVAGAADNATAVVVRHLPVSARWRRTPDLSHRSTGHP